MRYFLEVECCPTKQYDFQKMRRNVFLDLWNVMSLESTFFFSRKMGLYFQHCQRLWKLSMVRILTRPMASNLAIHEFPKIQKPTMDRTGDGIFWSYKENGRAHSCVCGFLLYSDKNTMFFRYTGLELFESDPLCFEIDCSEPETWELSKMTGSVVWVLNVL